MAFQVTVVIEPILCKILTTDSSDSIKEGHPPQDAGYPEAGGLQEMDGRGDSE